jgi:hypothetical protein
MNTPRHDPSPSPHRYTVPLHRDDDEATAWRVVPGLDHGTVYSPERLAAELLILSRQVSDLAKRQEAFEDEIKGGVSSVRKWVLGMVGTLIMSVTTILTQAGVYQERIANIQATQTEMVREIKTLRHSMESK